MMPLAEYTHRQREFAERSELRARCGLAYSGQAKPPAKKRRAGRRRITRTTAGARKLEMSVRVLELQREIQQIKEAVAELMQSVDPRELAAKERLERLTPDNATLLKIASELPPYPERYSHLEEEKPW